MIVGQLQIAIAFLKRRGHSRGDSPYPTPMSKQISIELAGRTLSGIATDMDAYYVMGIMLPEFFKIREQESGLRQALKRFSEEHRELLEAAEDPAKREALAEQIYDAWGERIMFRLANNLDVRSGFAQRICEIFPDIDKTLVSHDRWTDRDGNVHDRSMVRLSAEQALTIVGAINAIIVKEEQSKPASKGKGFAAKPQAKPTQRKESAQDEVEPLQPEEPVEDEIALLRAKIAELEAKG